MRIKLLFTIALFVGFFNFKGANAQFPQNGLLARWLFCGNANDTTGNGNTGTVINAILTADRFGNANSAYNFDGSTGYITMGTQSKLYLSSAVSISAWINPRSFAEGGAIVRNGLAYDLQYAMMLGKGGKISFHWYDGAFKSISTPTVLDVNKWYHLVTIRKADNSVELYVNGKLDTAGMATAATGTGGIINIGSTQTNNAFQDFDGFIDDVAIWNRALDANEVKAVYNDNPTTNLLNNKLALDINIEVYPNPSLSQITILGAEKGSIVNIYDIQGKLVVNQQLNNTNIVDLTSISKGVYNIKIINQNKIYNNKLIKN